MRCFNHPDRDAIGSCKACAKGLCSECAIDLGHGLSCHGEHEKTVESYRVMLERNTKMLDAAPGNALIGPAFLFLLGLVLVGYGFSSRAGIYSSQLVVGCGMVIFGIVSFIRNRKTFPENRNDT